MKESENNSRIIEQSNKEKFDGGIYDAKTITKANQENPVTFSDRLLHRNISTVRKLIDHNSAVMDLCCANGEHLFSLTGEMGRAVGVDFSLSYLKEAHLRRMRSQISNVYLVLGDAHSLPLANDQMDMVYSLSSLYVIPRVNEVIAEVARVLKPGGHFLADLGNSRSLNRIVCKYYPELATTCLLPSGVLLSYLEQAGFEVVWRRCYQILPLWGQRPAWLKPLLWPGWERLLRRYVRGKMLDEWICSLPGLRRLAFRQVFLCRKK